MKRLFVFAIAWVILATEPAPAGEPAADARNVGPASSDRPAAAQYREAIQLENRLDLTRAERLYQAIVRECDSQREWLMVRNAQQGLRRIEDLRAEFSLTEAELQKKLAQTYRGFQQIGRAHV